MANGKKMALALGGGSARGFAHIGVLNVLIKNKVPIHSIAGCSMGSLIGGIFASEGQIEALENPVSYTHLDVYKRQAHNIFTVLNMHVKVTLAEPQSLKRFEGKAQRVTDNRSE